MRKLAWVLGGLLLLIGGGIGAALLLFNPEAQKPRIIEAVKQATGRDLRLSGKIGLALSLRPTLEIRDVGLSNPAGFSRPEMVTLEKIDLRLALLPLLSRRVEIASLIVTRPDVRLETDAKGTPNWIFTPIHPAAPVAAPSAPAGGDKAPMAISIEQLRLENGMFAYHDGKTGQSRTLAIARMETQSLALDTPLHLTALVNLDGTDLAITADTGPLSRLTSADPAAALWPVKLALTAGEAKFSAEGTVKKPKAGQGIDLAIAADIPDLAALANLAKQPLPALRAIALKVRLTDEAGGLALHDLKFASSAGDLAGDLAVGFGPPHRLVGKLASDRLDLDGLMPAPPAAKPAPAPTPAPAKAARLIPDRPLPFGALQLLTADLRVDIGALRAGGAEVRKLQAHALLKDGILTLDPASADLPAGHVALTLSADAGKAAPPVHLTLRAPGIALESLLVSLGQPPYATGNLEVMADLHGAGESPHAIAASLEGVLGLAMAGGTIDARRIAGAGARVLEAVNPQKSAGASALRCFAVRLDFAHGVGMARALTIGSALLNMDGSGSINLGDETLALLLKSRALVAGAAVTVPVKVSGPIAAPQTKVDEIGIAQSNAAALGSLLGGSVGAAISGGGEKPAAGDACPAALALARGQAPPAEAAPAAASPQADPAPDPAPQPKPPNAGQLLKQLFR